MHDPTSPDTPAALAGLDLLVSAVVLLDEALCIRYCNPVAENLFAISRRACLGRPVQRLCQLPPSFIASLEDTLHQRWSYTRHDIVVPQQGHDPLHLDCSISPLETSMARLLLEFHPINQQLQTAREEHEAMQQVIHRELLRNLAHEIKNPLGGIRGSAQLLERELDDPELRQFTQVIIDETDRLQALMQRLLSSYRTVQPTPLNIHEVLELCRTLMCAEFPAVRIERDYDISLPDLSGNREQLVQALLNIVRNAAQAVQGRGRIQLRTRIQRQVTLVKKRHPLVLEVQVIDDGPGVPEEIRDRVFYPLVSARAGGSGLGLALAHDFIQQHHGSIEVESVPGRTCFTVRLPLPRLATEDAQ
ncbi:MAG TPA: nitrogen regulation protein NR(II) [Thiobacillaceae bacterium]|nr:nitrogen regulation protein NR(II) [Thiobacillaceae bacterium]HNU64476.1 nitrogen regulation protein NR(II) [Thiobacillaceae bacterium]